MSCWPQIARKLGFMKDWKTPCRNGLGEMKKEDEARNVSQMIKSADGSAGLFTESTSPWHGEEGMSG